MGVARLRATEIEIKVNLLCFQLDKHGKGFVEINYNKSLFCKHGLTHNHRNPFKIWLNSLCVISSDKPRSSFLSPSVNNDLYNGSNISCSVVRLVSPPKPQLPENIFTQTPN